MDLKTKKEQCVKGLSFLKKHAMEYQEDFDWDENPCGTYENISEEDLKEYVEPLEQLIKDYFKLISLLETWDLKGFSVDELDKWYNVQMINYENVQKSCTSYFNKMNELSKKLQHYEWIPCNKRLPDEPEYYDEKEGYFVQKDDWAPFEAYWDGEYWTDSDGDRVKNVIAWMPLPYSYKG